jgi:Holliday junction resolvase-like predicted endonuclease
MTVSRDLLVSLLKLTQTGSVTLDSVQRDSRLPKHVLGRHLLELRQNGLVRESSGLVELAPSQRIRVAFLALQAGADLRRVCVLLSWREFEKIAADAFELNGFEVIKNLHFTQGSRRWEMDVIAFDKPLIVCADCKHWKRGWHNAATAKAAQGQADRTEAFTKALPRYCQKMKLEKWQTARLVPMILSLEAGPTRFFDGVPIVPVLQLQDFISELPANSYLLKSFCQKGLSNRENLESFI